MAGKTYNAGTIFLQVVPVFGDVQRAIGREAKDWNKALGDEMEKGGQEAGRRAADRIGEELEKGAKRDGQVAASAFQREFAAAVKGISKGLEPIDLRFQSNDIRRQVKQIREEIEELSDVEIKTDLDAKQAEARIRILSAQLAGLQEDAKLNAKLDVKQALAAAEVFEKRLDSLQKAADIEVRMETKMAERQIGAFEKKIRETARKSAAALGDSMNPAIRRIKAELDGLADAEIGIDVSDEQARRKIEELMREARRLAFTSPEIQVKVDAGKAEVELAALYAQMRLIDGDDIDINVDVDTGAAAAKMGALRSLFQGGGVEAAANSFRSFNIRVLAAVTLLPALIPIAGAVGGALLGLVPILASVGAGFGAMLVGFSGIGDAVSALGDQADSAGKDTNAASKTIRAASYAVVDARQAVADAERNAAQASADAARQVADARRSAAEAIEDAIDRQREAQEAYRDSVKDVREAEADLREARKRAAEEQAAASADTKDKIRQNQLDIREAVLGAFDATNTYNAVMADGSSTAYDKEAAEVAMLQARERLHELRDTEKELAAERKKQRKDGVGDSAAVESAEDALTAALERQRDAQEAVGEAAEEVHEARVDGARRVQDAIRNQARVEADGARSVARAQEQLRRAQEAYGQALYDTGELGSASMQKVEQAMGKLGPAGRRFARFLFSLRDNFYAFRDSIQSAMLPGVERAMRTIISTYGPQFTAFMTEMGAVVGNFFERLAGSLRGDAWRGFFAVMDRLGPKMAAEFGQTTINWLEVFASIMTAVAPFAERMSRAMLGISEAVAQWAASKGGQDAVTRFMEYAERIGPKVIDFVESFVAAAINLAVALAPWGTLVMDALNGLFDWIASMDPDTLGLIAGALIGMTIAWQAAVGAVAAFYGGLSAFQTVGGRLVFGILGVVVVLALLAIRFEGFRDLLISVGGWIKDHADLLMNLATVVLIAVAAYRTYRFIMAVVAGVQLGLAAATYGAVGATYAQGFAAKATYIIMRVWHGITKAMTAAQWALNVAMRANPLGLALAAVVALAAGMVWAYRHFEGFRRVVDTVINAVAAAFHWLWDFLFGHSVMPDIVDGMKWAADWIGRIFGWIGDFIRGGAKVFKWLWEKAVKPAFTFIKKIVGVVFKAIRFYWKNILWPVIKVIAKVVWTLWKTYFKVVFGAIKLAWKVLVVAMKLAWKLILQPVFSAIAKVIKWLWEKVGKPIFGFLGRRWDTLMRNMKAVWDKVLAPMFKFIGEKVLPRLKGAFERTVDGIKKIWDGLKKVVGTPIKFVIETVLNNGLIAGFNKVANFVNGPTIGKIPVPEWTYARGSSNALDGGTLPGYTPGRDVHDFYSPTAGRLRLSGGEAILRPEATMALGSGWVDEINRAARFGGARGVRRALGGGGRGYYMGGVIPLLGAHVSTHSGYSGYAADFNVGSGDDDYGMPVRAWKSGVIAAMRYIGDQSYGRWMDINHGGQFSRYAHLSAFASGLRSGMRISQGQTLGYVGSVGNSSGPHLHFEINGGELPIGATDLGGSKGGDGGRSFPGWIIDIAKNPFGYAKDLVMGPIDKMKEKFGQSEMLGQIAALPVQALKSVGGKIWDMMPAPIKKAAGVLGDVYDIGKGAVGALGSGLDAITPGDGVPFVDAFAKGGILPYNGTMMYDSGGYLPPGITQVVNLTGKPEPVFTHDQFEGMRESGGGITYAPTITEANLTSEDLMDDFEFTIRKLGRKGTSKYEGVQS